MLKMVMDRPEYEHRKIMTVISLPKHYKNIISFDSIGNFFGYFLMTRENNNVDDADVIVFPGSKVEVTAYNQIWTKRNSLSDWNAD